MNKNDNAVSIQFKIGYQYNTYPFTVNMIIRIRLTLNSKMDLRLKLVTVLIN